jgi:hypothetical protein
MTLGVAELSGKTATATQMAQSGAVGDALVQYISCVMLACRELLQARGLAAFSAADDARQRIATETGQIVDLARYCLDQAHSLLRLELQPETAPTAVATAAVAPVVTVISPEQPQAHLSSSSSSPSLPPPSLALTQSLQLGLPTVTALGSVAAAPPLLSVNRPVQARSRSWNRMPTSGAPSTDGTQAMPAIAEEPWVPGLELVPGVEIDRRYVDALRKLDSETLARASEPARELQALNRFLAKKHQDSLAKLNASQQGTPLSRQHLVSELNLSWLRQ